ncbi:MAG: hypothetical protein AAGA90_14095 [Actinomycetota bacterium]
MRIHARLRVLAALFAVALFAAACGDDESPIEAASSDDVADTADTADEEHDHDHDHDHDDHDHSDADSHDGHDDHDHGEPVEIDAANAPTVDVEVDADPAGGINIHVTTTDFTVAADAASTEHVEGEGHFHLYIDGDRKLRFYNESIYYPGVTEGEVEVMVELSANDHRAYAVDGEAIVAMVAFDVPPHDHGDHDHGDAETVEWTGDAPELAIEVVEDPESGYNAFVTLSGMTLSAEAVNGDNVAGEGHLHIYANGQKLGRLYGTETHIPVLSEGEVEITVAAFSNDHSQYVLDGDPIEASTTITVAS